MRDYTPEDRLPQPLRRSLQKILLRCVDMAESKSDAKAMILTMYESGMLSAAETFAHIASRRLEAE